MDSIFTTNETGRFVFISRINMGDEKVVRIFGETLVKLKNITDTINETCFRENPQLVDKED